MEAAVLLAPSMTSVCLRTEHKPPPDAYDAAHVADAAVRLARALAQVGWYEHQHGPLTMFVTERESIPLATSHVTPEARDIAASIERRLREAFVNTPQPMLRTQAPTVRRSQEDGHVCLPIPDNIPPSMLERTFTWSGSEDESIALWSALVPELAMAWATLPSQPPLSLGRVFRERRKGRMCYWPKRVNDLLAFIPISYDHIADLVRALTLVGFKVDLKAAFRSIIITAAHARLYGACVDGVYLQFHRAPFGSGVSPAHFVLHLRNTIVKVRGSTPAFDQVLAAFVDDIGGAAGASPSISLTEASTNMLRLAERLIAALIEDGWWISLAKTFLWPATTLFYTGLLGNLAAGSIAIEPHKALSLRQRIAVLEIPSLEVLSRLTVSYAESSIVPQIRTACHSHCAHPLILAALPIRLAEWPAVPLISLLVAPVTLSSTFAPSSATATPWPTITCMPDDAIATVIARNACENPPGRFTIVAVSTLAEAEDFTVSFPPDSLPPDRVVIVLYPRAQEPIGTPTRWFDASMALPARFNVRRPLPSDTGHPQLPQPHDLQPPPVPPRTHSRDDVDMSPDEWHALRGIAGLLSWFSTVVPHLSAWRPAMDTAWRSARWSVAAVEAVWFMWDIAPFLPGWTRDMRHAPHNPLHVVVDTSKGSWASVRVDNARPIFDVGTIPMHAITSSTLSREAWGVLGAIRSAIRQGATFDAIIVENDNEGLTLSAATPHVPKPDAAPPMRSLAALDYQGIVTTWRWTRRSLGCMPVADALSPAAGVRVYPLQPHIASYVHDLAGGWHADGPSDATRKWARVYMTASMPEATRMRLFESLALTASTATDGWIGDVRTWPSLSNGRTLFAHPAWSELPIVAQVARATRDPLIVIAPQDGAGQWWAPALRELQAMATATRKLPQPCVARPPPPPGTPHDKVHAMVRPLAVYFIRMPLGPRPAASPRPEWWSPYRLTACGDVELNPGPVAQEDTGSFARPRTGPCHPTAQPPAVQTQPRHALALRCEPPLVSQRSRMPQQEDLSGFARPLHPRLAAVHDAHVPCANATTTRVRKSPLAAAAISATALRLHVPQPMPTRGTSAAPVTARAIVAAHAAAPTVPTPLTIQAWLNAVRSFTAGESAGILDDDMPLSLRPTLAVARSTCRLKAVLGSSRPMRALRYLMLLASSLPDVMIAPLNLRVVDALAVAYAVRRLEPRPPFSWKVCKQADTPASDLSSIAAMSRRAGHPLPEYCGATAAAYLTARGAGAKKENSDAWPIHLADLLTIEPADTTSDAWRTWSALVIISAFCLRPGVAPHLAPSMFLRWDGGYILVWRWAFKATTGVDILDPELRSPTIRVTGARFPRLDRIFAQAAHLGTRPWSKCTSENMSAFVRAAFPSAPKGFTLRPYGIRIAADVAAMALDLPEDMTNAIFWWRRLVQSMRTYYGALSILRMFIFSEARTRLRCVHVTPGRFDARLDGPVPDFSCTALLKAASDLPPAPQPCDLEAVWGNDGTTLARQRLEGLVRVTLPAAVWCPLPAAAPAPASDDDAASVDCDKCDSHVSRYRRATLCSHAACPAGRCTSCHEYNTDWLCDEHKPVKTRRRRK